MRPVEPIRRITSCSAPISILKTATGSFSCTATCSPMLSAKAVLPTDGRAATMIRSPGCMPEVIRSRSTKPVAMPVISLGLSRL